MMNFMVMFLSTQARLLEQLVKQPDTQILFGMRNADVPRLGGMHKNVVTALCTTQYPAICFQQFDQSGLFFDSHKYP